MGDLIAFEDFKKDAKDSQVLTLFKGTAASRARRRAGKSAPNFPTVRTGISGNLGDLFEQANAVVMRHYEGDKRVPEEVARKCLELLDALSKYAEPE
ncbi:hypothetical protein [Microvirga rosea]|uniref:hypothetical protein n=1 Tax=Microvirga rosea TaxID=2715425 RepID=UPI001D0B89AD|nr:hypothetical protein [Microvirga rosea]MCB8820276.1 hypothetical protein [Microvirga rosea]